MAGANDKQVGGSHYGGGSYQHWDFVEDAPLRYLPARATAYIDRYKTKNGYQDLEKAVHFLDKAIERRTPAPLWAAAVGPLEKFLDARNTPQVERRAMAAIVMGDYTRAKSIIQDFLMPAIS